MIRAFYFVRHADFDDGAYQDCYLVHVAGVDTGVLVPTCMFDDQSDCAVDLISALVSEVSGVNETLPELRAVRHSSQAKGLARHMRRVSLRLNEQGVVNVIGLLGSVEEVRLPEYLSACRFTAPTNANFGAPDNFDLTFYLRNLCDCHVLSSFNGELLVAGPLAATILRAAKRALKATVLATALREGEQ